jgi:hypothetical protein
MHYIVFIFVDMISLTFLYCFGFCYIRIQLRKFNRIITSTEQSTADLGQERWHADLETMVSPTRASPREILTTRMVSVTTEERGIDNLTPKVSNDVSHDLRPPSMNQSQLLSQKRMMQVASTLLWYPLVYLCCTIPLAVSRLATFPGDHWASISIFPSVAIYASGGWCNVLLYTLTRKGIVPWSSLCGRNKKKYDPAINSGYAPYSPSPSVLQHSLGQNESHWSITTSNQLKRSNNVRKKYTPLIQSPPPLIIRDSLPIMKFDAFDTTFSNEFNMANSTDDSKLIHDQHSTQTQTDSRRSSDTTICASQNIPKYEMNAYNYS